MLAHFPEDNLNQAVGEENQRPDYARTRCQIHAQGVECYTDNVFIQSLVARALRFFPSAPLTSTPALRIWLTGRQQWQVPSSAQVLPPSSNEVVDVRSAYGLTPRFARTETLNYFELNPVAGVAYEFGTGQAFGYVQTNSELRPQVIANLFWQTVLLELLRGVGLFWVHAASVAVEGRAVLLVGHTGSGKTTTSLNLVLSGFNYLSQDRTLLQIGESGLAVLGFPEDLAITSKTLELLPDLKQRAGPLPPPTGKYQLDPSTVFPHSFVAQARPGLILFPHITDSAQNRLQALSPQRALQRLLPNSLLASHPQIARQHFEALSQLVEGSQAFDLELGRDLKALPDLIRQQLLN